MQGCSAGLMSNIRQMKPDSLWETQPSEYYEDAESLSSTLTYDDDGKSRTYDGSRGDETLNGEVDADQPQDDSNHEEEPWRGQVVLLRVDLALPMRQSGYFGDTCLVMYTEEWEENRKLDKRLPFILDQKEPQSSHWPKLNVFQGVIDLEAGLSMDAGTIRDVLEAFCLRSFGIRVATARGLRDLYNCILKPSFDTTGKGMGNFYRNKLVDGQETVDPVILKIGGYKIPNITPSDAICTLFSVVLHLESLMEEGMLWAATMLFDTWMRRLYPSFVEGDIGICWLEDGVLFMFCKDEVFRPTTSSESCVDEAVTQAILQNETLDTRKSYLYTIYNSPDVRYEDGESYFSDEETAYFSDSY
ncbi:hypothetical protein BJ508DRAFT_374284 [Ascobolus immersus RN42]|uniref:Uncharacterized protein n=1 Tax=Ascobolus immersus RN42 TaxID=1160509 RepID=A0A3N4IFR4_ASCIM|nr:hypothetical protein BJ508DRAFT_374284 [Ascobolus immersus RN42]